MAAVAFNTRPTEAGGIALRFRAYKQGNLVRLNGYLSAETRLSLLDDLRGPDLVYDLSGVSVATWGGILGFFKYMKAVGSPVRIRGVPKTVFQYLRLLVAQSEAIIIEDAGLETFNVLDLTRPGDERRFAIADLQRLAVEQGPILSPSPGQQILGIAEHVCPSYFQTTGAPAPLFTNAWCQKNSEEAVFWFNFTHAISTVFSLGVDQLDAARQQIGPLAADLSVRVESVDRALAELGLIGRSAASAAVQQNLIALMAQIEAFSASFKGIDAARSYGLRAIQVACWTRAMLGPQPLYQAVLQMVDALRTVDHHGLDVEECKRITVDALRNDDSTSRVLEALKSTPLEGQTDEKLNRLRDIFNVMDIFSHGKWGPTIAAIEAELVANGIDLSVASGFIDQLAEAQKLLRVLAEDLNAISPLLNQVAHGASRWEEVRNVLFTRWASRKPTIEERYVYGFYLPAAFSGQRTNGAGTTAAGEDLDLEAAWAEYKVPSAGSK